jgi:pimeloyl-ACP methyl ester carboxylesterase
VPAATTIRRKLIPDGASEHFIVVDGHRFRYLTAGSGPPLLLVHGLMGFSFSWSENLTAFAQHFTVVAPDLLNLGYSDRCDVDPSLEANGRRLLRFIDAVGLSQTALIGSSHGGAIALMAACLSPERVSSMILVSPASPVSESGRWQIRLFASLIGPPLAETLKYLPAWIRRLLLWRIYSDPKRALPGTLEEYFKAFCADGTFPYLLKIARRWETDFADLAARMSTMKRIPSLLLWGADDFIVPLKHAKALQQLLPGSRVAVIPQAGHLPYEEQPELFNRIALDFLTESSRTTPAVSDSVSI